MELIENKAMIEVCLSCPRRTCHPVRCARYDEARRKLGIKPVQKGKKYFARGEWKSMSEWARVSGIHVKVLYGRVVKFGWSMEKALTVPVGEPRRYDAKGMSLTVPKWAEVLGISDVMIYARLRQGWDMEQIAAHYGGRK